MHTALESTRHVALVRLGRSLCIFSLRCRSTLQRCPKKSDNHPVKHFYCFQAVNQTQRCTSPRKAHSPDTTVHALRKVTIILSSSFIASTQSARLKVVRAQEKHIRQPGEPGVITLSGQTPADQANHQWSRDAAEWDSQQKLSMWVYTWQWIRVDIQSIYIILFIF